MYNDRRYSLTRFSVNRENRALDIRESFSEVLGAVAGAAVPVDFRSRFSETAQLNAMGTVSVVSAFSALAELTAASRPSADVVSCAAFGEDLQGAAHGKKNTPAALEAAEILSVRIWGAKNTPAVKELAGVLTARIAGSINECPDGTNCLGSSDLYVGGHVPDHGADNGSTDNPAGGGTANRQRAFSCSAERRKCTAHAVRRLD